MYVLNPFLVPEKPQLKLSECMYTIVVREHLYYVCRYYCCRETVVDLTTAEQQHFELRGDAAQLSPCTLQKERVHTFELTHTPTRRACTGCVVCLWLVFFSAQTTLSAPRGVFPQHTTTAPTAEVSGDG